MAFPVLPIALSLLRFAAFLALVVAISRRDAGSPENDATEAALDALPLGGHLSGGHLPGREKRLRAGGKWQWTLRGGQNRPQFAIEAAVLGRLRLRRI